MLKPYEMDRIIVTGPKKVQQKVIRELYDLKVLHIVEHSKNELADIGQPLENSSKLSEIMVMVRALITSLNVKEEGHEFKSKLGLVEILQTTKKLNEETNKNLEELRAVEEKLSKNNSIKKELETLKDTQVDVDALTQYNSLSYFSGYVKGEYDLKNLNDKLSATTQKFAIFKSMVKKKLFLILFIDKGNKEIALRTLQEIGFSFINFANLGNLKGTAAENLAKIEKENTGLGRRKSSINKRIEKLNHDYCGFLITAQNILKMELEKAEAPLKFAATRDAFLVKGWIPTGQLDATIKRLHKVSNEKIFIEHEPAKLEDKVPVKHKKTK